MTRKSKRELTKAIMDEAVDEYDDTQSLDIPIEELTGNDNLNGFNTLL